MEALKPFGSVTIGQDDLSGWTASNRWSAAGRYGHEGPSLTQQEALVELLAKSRRAVAQSAIRAADLWEKLPEKERRKWVGKYGSTHRTDDLIQSVVQIMEWASD